MKGPILFLGIGGSGMSSLAHMALDLKLPVLGYDQKNTDTTEYLKKRGALIQNDISLIALEGIEMVVYSSAINDKHKQVFEDIKKKNIPLKHRSEFMHLLVSNQKSISVAGSHGKTSTTTMVSQILSEVGMDPTIMIGGDTSLLEKRGGKIGSGNFAVYESDESDGTFLKHKASIRLLTNIDNDHLDYYKTREKLEDAFLEYISFGTPGDVVLYAKDQGIRDVLLNKTKAIIPSPQFRLFLCLEAEDTKSDWYRNLETKLGNHLIPVIYQIKDDHLTFSFLETKNLNLHLPYPGVHYLTNGLVALVGSYVSGVSPKISSEILSRYIGVKRRQEILGHWNGVTVMDDYGHHPTEISMVIRSLKNKLKSKGRLIVLFQPHRYTRTQLLLRELAESLTLADSLLMLPIYSAGESPIAGINHESFIPFLDPKNTEYLKGEMDLDLLVIKDKLQKGDLLLCLGAGNVRDWGRQLLKNQS
ncbi:UDP-N-acetylmuramate--L-alanine ligase [Leptospira sp. 2 VSF19]|uniref:UDP-N-acetylmuramate--L-alanine ligase n=1 Tax=Leptospira soteropolitanensis TaxID=2950025 RepID=A0AAW5VE46_9LEPT|nr:UDP-N-acetylmuramate--L-alanine ligase [Leptospira soteropolitanensis]MCW7492131.1 UDP-N-acetylmuramate--L-alanine ligase [Leptospira soteropolitanensis]MCW7499713.1 UDP-N-acetylmuramate--L-alanine ligase [Leptospira soteropolitanensis]MCW7521964.1 UDP-N-acetylmuramate--L-alanine ligase [Leptospira soteropolitanensis]MCW7525818.1 UDP-N-acetylmuramate--L-alanine ligase [Leptospira soteropolitanensis]MCW7530068.1 UDP-N-acetylmuramate--L-alanine ligase [Leptospira soteropolitanensis]